MYQIFKLWLYLNLSDIFCILYNKFCDLYWKEYYKGRTKIKPYK